MLNLKTKLTLTEAVTKSPNLCERFDEEDLCAIGEHVSAGYEADEQSRMRWATRMEAAMDLAMQVVKEKSFPWPGSSNVKFPLVTIGAMQFHSRAYPAIVHGPDIVKYRVTGPDPDGQAYLRATRIGEHMSNQLLEVDQGWEEGMDRLLINLPIVGCAFKKSYYSVAKGHNVSELVLARDFCLDYYAKSVEDCARKTHLIPYYRNQIYEFCVSGVWEDILEESWYQAASTYQPRMQEARQDMRTGSNAPQTDYDTPFLFGEQHCWLDLDQDGYAEPYIVTFCVQSKYVVRIVARWDRMEDIQRNKAGRILRIVPIEYFTKYGFIPSPDNSVYDIGFGLLLGPLNASVDSLINQLIDAGTMATTAGGFLGRGVKIRGGKLTFSPLEWNKVDSTGDDLRKDIVPLPVREPSPVLFQLLGLLVDYAQRIPGTTDIMVGQNIGQNTPAATARSLVEQGSKIYTALFKRVWRCMKMECKKLYILNGKYLPERVSFGDAQTVYREDYLDNPDNMVPSADPTVVSEEARLNRIMLVKGAAASTPGYNLEAVEREWLRALGVEGIGMLYPGPDQVPPLPDAKSQVEAQKLELAKAELQLKQMQLQTETQLAIAELMEQRRVNSAKIVELEARAQSELAGVALAEAGHRIAAFSATLGLLKHHDDSLLRLIGVLNKGMIDGTAATSVPTLSGGPTALPGAMGGMEQPALDAGLPALGGEAEAGIDGAMV